VLQRQFPEEIIQPLLYGRMVLDRQESGAMDAALLQKWVQEINEDGTQSQQILLLEIEARLRRLARSVEISRDVPGKVEKPESQSSNQNKQKAEKMAQYIATHYTEPIRVQDIAEAAGLSSCYANTLFRGVFSSTLVGYIAHYRVAHAQKLLLTTDWSITKVALESGFSSISQFYSVFKKSCGVSPNLYRSSPYGQREVRGGQERG
jgi:YesN/AraC family two-component response regulator